MISRKILTNLPKISYQKNTIWGETEFLSQAEILPMLSSSSAEVEVIKNFSRRFIFRVFSNTCKKTFVVKSFPFKKLLERRKYRKYGLREFINYQQAKKAEIPIPKCYAYFEQRHFGLVSVNGIVIEDLCGYRDLHGASQEFSSIQQIDILKKSIPIILLCFNKGANHIDLSPHNILLNSQEEIKVLDWQYCKFVPPRQINQLLFHAAHFLRYSQLKENEELSIRWLDELYMAGKISISRQEFVDRVQKLIKQNKISITDRLNLNIDKYLGQ